MYVLTYVHIYLESVPWPPYKLRDVGEADSPLDKGLPGEAPEEGEGGGERELSRTVLTACWRLLLYSAASK